jgi:hypothetical protein
MGVLLSLWNEARHHYEIRLIDPATGQAVPGHTLSTVSDDLSYTLPAVVSADGQKLMAVGSRGQSCEPFAGGTSCRPSADVLYFINLPTWREVTATLPEQGWLGPLAFSPSATHLALAHHQQTESRLMLFDTRSGQLVADRVLEFRPSLVAYGRDGATLVIYGAPLGPEPGLTKPGSPRILLLDATTLDISWEQTLPEIVSGSWCEENCAAPHEERLFAHRLPAVVLSSDGRKLYLVHADEARLTAVDLVERAVNNVETMAAQSWFEQFLAFTAGTAQAKGGTKGAFKTAVLSPDGTRLYVLGRTMEATHSNEGYWQTSETSLGLQVIAVESGHKIASRDTEATGIRLTSDGAYLLLDGWSGQEQWTEALDAESLENVARLAGWEVVLTRRIDGQPAILARQPGEELTQLAVLDAQSFEIVHAWPVKSYASWVAMP